jgi:hypothetical protein
MSLELKSSEGKGNHSESTLAKTIPTANLGQIPLDSPSHLKNQQETNQSEITPLSLTSSKEPGNGPKKTRLSADNLNKNADNLNANLEKPTRPSKKSEKRGFTKGTWKPDEDKQLISLVSNFGPQNWTRIAEFIPHRSGKQCRERWHNHLNPNINKQKWSIEEDRILIEAHKK